jgi:hypothetical protein
MAALAAGPSWASVASAQAPARPAAAPLKEVAAVRISSKIVVDGRLDETEWQQAVPATGFVQRDPDEGKPATEETEIRILYDDDAIYVGARMFDREPARIARRLTRRDGDTEGIADAIIIGFDPHHDHLTGAAFQVTAAGSQFDEILDNDEDSDSTWDAVWDAAVAIDDKGWTAEFRIPFSQLRFPAAERQVWGFHAVRIIQRKNEESWWVPIPKKDSGVVSRAGHLTGLDAVRSRRHLDVLPYATARSEISGTAAPDDPFNSGRHASAGAGLDLKWGFTSNMTLDATVNPDFGQVEVDPAVVNLTAFETFYEEKRPFFIEGSQAFSKFGRNGSNGFMGFNRTNPTLFYSRRIGRSPQGRAPGEYVDRPESTTIIGAAKLTGKTRSGWTVNFIDAATSREWADTATGPSRNHLEVEPFTNYVAARARRDVGQRAGFGVLATSVNRDLQDPALATQLADSALVLGGDGHYFLSAERDYVVTGSFSTSRVGGTADATTRLQRSSARYYQRPDATHLAYDPTATSLSGWNLQSDFNRNGGTVRPNASFWAVSPGFEVNDAGYVTNVDRMGMHAAVVWLKPTPDRFTRNRSLVLAKWNTWNFAGDAMGDGYFASFDSTFSNYWSLEAGAHFGPEAYSDRLNRGGPMMRVPAFATLSAEIRSDDRKAVEFGLDGSYETRPDGSWSAEGQFDVTMKPIPSLSISLEPTWNRQFNNTQYVRTVADAAVTSTYGARYVFAGLDQTELSMDTRINVILSPRMSLQAYLQPLFSVGRYTGFKQAAMPRTADYLTYGVDLGTIAFDQDAGVYRVMPGDGGSPFLIANPDFNFKSLRVNAVYRWEFRPGSTLYVVWTQLREDEVSDGQFAFNRDIAKLMRAPSDNVFMVKMSYWFSR